MKGKKGTLSLRTVAFIIIFCITVTTGYIYWAYDGVKHYDVTIEEEFNDSFKNITAQADSMHNDSQTVITTLNGLFNDPSIQSYIAVPSAILTVIKLPFSYAQIFWNVTNEFAKVLHVPAFILLALEAALFFMIGYLLIDAFMRFKNS